MNLHELRTDSGPTGIASVLLENNKLLCLRQQRLLADLFADLSPPIYLWHSRDVGQLGCPSRRSRQRSSSIFAQPPAKRASTRLGGIINRKALRVAEKRQTTDDERDRDKSKHVCAPHRAGDSSSSCRLFDPCPDRPLLVLTGASMTGARHENAISSAKEGNSLHMLGDN